MMDSAPEFCEQRENSCDPRGLLPQMGCSFVEDQV